MTIREALELDKCGELYIDFDPETNCHGIFGSESGFCYSIGEKEDLEKWLEELKK